MLSQTQSFHTQNLLPNPCNFCHVSFGQQWSWVEVSSSTDIRGSAAWRRTEDVIWRVDLGGLQPWRSPSTYVATHDECLKAIKADSGGLLTPPRFNRLEYRSEITACTQRWQSLELSLWSELFSIPWNDTQLFFLVISRPTHKWPRATQKKNAWAGEFYCSSEINASLIVILYRNVKRKIILTDFCGLCKYLYPLWAAFCFCKILT